MIMPSWNLLLFSKRKILGQSRWLGYRGWVVDWRIGLCFHLLLTCFLYNTSADVKAICLLPLPSVWSLSSWQCSPRVSFLAQDHFQRLNFQSKYTIYKVNSISENRSYHIFFQGNRWERGGCWELSVSLFHMASRVEVASINVLPNWTAAERNKWVREEGGLREKQMKGTTLAKWEV